MNHFRSLTSGIATLLLAAIALSPANAAALKAKSVVLVHGAFADGSSWNRVIPLLRKAGLKAVAVQNPLVSLEGDVAFTKRAIDSVEGPVVLVGHSWGGMVITEAGDHKKVKSLVYVAAMAPNKGQSLMEASQGYPSPKGAMMVQADSHGFYTMTADNMAKYFAQDLPKSDVETMAATQGALNGVAFGQKVTKSAWSGKTNFYAVSSKDLMINPELQKAFAKKLKAKTVTLDASHVPMLSKPQAIADLIIEAAK